MINEWEEFCAYTGTVSYTASKKSDTTWLGRFTFATILEFELSLIHICGKKAKSRRRDRKAAQRRSVGGAHRHRLR